MGRAAAQGVKAQQRMSAITSFYCAPLMVFSYFLLSLITALSLPVKRTVIVNGV